LNSKTDKRTLVREQAESDLEAFIRLVHPNRVLGSIHKEIIRWWNREGAKSHQLLLMPRDHQKSAMVAYRVAWMITKNPAVRVLYISSTANLAIKQLKFIKDILTSDIYSFYWPEMVNPEEGKREKWTETEVSVDHPKRKQELVRDPTIFTAGLTTSITGLHCDIAVLDDVVVRENAYTEEGREKTKQQYSLLSSIEGADAQEWAVGTRYHPRDLYNDMVEMEVDFYDEYGDLAGSEPLYEKFECQVESYGDGTGEFIWPRQQRSDGKWFGFDQAILAKKRAQYLDKTQFRAQYYNDPNDASEASIARDLFQYYDRSFLTRREGRWYYQNRRLNVFAAIDFAYSLSKKSDYTSIVVVGVDSSNNYYVLDIERFKTKQVSEYFARILQSHQKWDFRKIRAEVTAAQDVIVEELKNNYIRRYGLALSVEGVRPTRHQGSKEERMDAILQPKYQNGQVWHYVGGNCQTLEEELVLQNPPHDDVKDALASALEMCVPPTNAALGASNRQARANLIGSTRFGGIR
jgi:phage terminase large subunit-like protein